MSSRLLDLFASISGYGAAAAVLIVVAKLLQPSKLDAIPTVGSSGWFGSYWAGLKFLTNATDIIQEGYEKHKSAPFKIAELRRWIMIVSSREHVEELRRAPDDALSIEEAINDEHHVEYTMKSEVRYSASNAQIVQSYLTRNIGTLYPDIRNEVTAAFDDVLDLKDNEWKSVPAVSSVVNIVCRTSNRVFVGLPLCRDPDWIDLNIRYTFDVVKGGIIIGLFPDFLKSMATGLFTNISQSNQRGRKLLGPIIEERQRCLNEYGNGWADKPNDFLSWLMEASEGPELAVNPLTTRILAINFAAIHTSSSSITQALFYLAGNPQYIKPLREEVEAVVEKEGWSKAALGKMRKVDSFIKECQRLEGMGSIGLVRKAVKDFTFSDGTLVPCGATVAAAIQPIHRDEAFYKNARAFEPFRFADLPEEDRKSINRQFVSTTPEYLPFGHGRHACPGRFFAANELKSMLAHIVVTYDVKLADNVARPPTPNFATKMTADPNAQVMFRRRVD